MSDLQYTTIPINKENELDDMRQHLIEMRACFFNVIFCRLNQIYV